jgi:hypothetical protein
MIRTLIASGRPSLALPTSKETRSPRCQSPWSFLPTTEASSAAAVHIYPLHDLVMVATGGICGAAVAIAIMDC